jgi:hypothetical protein
MVQNLFTVNVLFLHFVYYAANNKAHIRLKQLNHSFKRLQNHNRKVYSSDLTGAELCH